MHHPIASRSWRRIPGMRSWRAAAPAERRPPRPRRPGHLRPERDRQPGELGDTLEVNLQNTGSTAVAIAAFSFELTDPGGSGITFQGADFNTAMNTYIFAGYSFLGPTLSASTGTTLDAGDVATPGVAIVGRRRDRRPGRVFFDVAGSAPSGPVTVSLTPYPITSLTDPNMGNIPIDTLTNGMITIRGAVVPEPSAQFLATLGFLGAAWLFRGRRATSR